MTMNKKLNFFNLQKIDFDALKRNFDIIFLTTKIKKTTRFRMRNLFQNTQIR